MFVSMPVDESRVQVYEKSVFPDGPRRLFVQQSIVLAWHCPRYFSAKVQGGSGSGCGHRWKEGNNSMVAKSQRGFEGARKTKTR